MNNKYKEYDNKDFTYSYPITWKKRNKEYLLKRFDRKLKKVTRSR